jgi:hypothetical protein
MAKRSTCSSAQAGAQTLRFSILEALSQPNCPRSELITLGRLKSGTPGSLVM